MGKAAQSSVLLKNFDIEIITDRTIEFYKNCIKQKLMIYENFI